jgi:hypothetical protein
MRMLFAATAAIGLLAAAAAAPAAARTAAGPHDVSCPTGYICLWDQTNFQGTRILRQPALGECTQLFYDGSSSQFRARSVIDNTTRTEVTLWTVPNCLLAPRSPPLVLSLGGSAAVIDPYAEAILST